MGFPEAVWGGFSSFYSIWQVCILQISPFFLVYLTGLFLAARSVGLDPGVGRWVLVPGAAYTVGFSILFAIKSSTGFYIGRYLNYHIEALSAGAGFIFLLLAVHLLLSGRPAWMARLNTLPLAAVYGLLIGLTFALIYSPCITPTLSTILGMSVRPELASKGSVLALAYGLGMSLAFLLAGAILITVLNRWPAVRNRQRWILDGCGVVMLILAGMNISGVMVYYKAFFLGLLVQ